MAENNSLTYPSFQKLNSIVTSHSENDDFKWFQVSYDAFKTYELKNGTDLVRLIAFAYSWMPTMAQFKSVFINNGDELAKAIIALKGVDSLKSFENREQNIISLLKDLFPLINNSMVGTSKVLHFANNNGFPIIDSWVVKGWRKFFNNKRICLETGIAWMPEYLLYDSSKAIELYISYCKNMLLWIEEIHKEEDKITLRDLEITLYLLGKSE